MDKTIYRILSETFKDKKSWNYYNDFYDFGKELPFLTKESSFNFLTNFIKISGKAEQELVNQINEIGDRLTHTVSVFFIGHFIYQNTILKNPIDKELKKLKQDCNTSCAINFPYLWFLTCLFHDLGYAIEKDKNLKYSNFDDLVSKSKELKALKGIPLHYETIYKEYFKYRIENDCKNDHGIVAAHLLFNSLCEIRKLGENISKSDLRWDEELEQVYNFCAWNILAHNIWHVNTDENCKSKQYQKAGLSDLILSKKNDEIEYKIKLDENPFFFLFCLVDTLEPFKRLAHLSKLKKICLNVSENKSKIIISTKLNCGCNDVILNQAMTLNDWLTVCKKENNMVEINL